MHYWTRFAIVSPVLSTFPIGWAIFQDITFEISSAIFTLRFREKVLPDLAERNSGEMELLLNKYKRKPLLTLASLQVEEGKAISPRQSSWDGWGGREFQGYGACTWGRTYYAPSLLVEEMGDIRSILNRKHHILDSCREGCWWTLLHSSSEDALDALANVLVWVRNV